MKKEEESKLPFVLYPDGPKNDEEDFELKKDNEIIGYRQSQHLIWGIEPENFKTLSPWIVLMVRKFGEKNMLNLVIEAKYNSTDPQEQEMFDKIATLIVKDIENHNVTNMVNMPEIEVDHELIKQHVPFIQSDSHNGMLEVAIRKGYVDQINKENFPIFRKLDDKHLDLAKLESLKVLERRLREQISGEKNIGYSDGKSQKPENWIEKWLWEVRAEINEIEKKHPV